MLPNKAMELTGRSRRCSKASIRRPPIKANCTAAAGGRDSVATRAAGSSSPIRCTDRKLEMLMEAQWA